MKGSGNLNKDMTTFSVESNVLSHSDFAQDDRFMHVKLSLCTENQKANGMHFSKELLESKMKEIDFMPIVGAIKIVEKDDGTIKYCLGSHEVELDIVDNELVYKKNTIVLGVALPNTSKFETITRHGESVEYITFEALLFQEKYPQLKSVIDLDTDASMELDKVEAEYSEDNGWYDVKDFRFLAHCLIGVAPAFKLAGVVQQFSMEDFKLEFSSILEEIKSSLNKCNNNDEEKGGDDVEEEIKVKETTTEELEQENVELETDNQETDVETEQTDTQEITNEEEGSDGESEEDMAKKKRAKCEKEFELSHDDIRDSIFNQINPIGEDGYREWNYWVMEVFDTYFVCKSEDESNKYYKFTFSKDQEKEVVTVNMDSKVEVFVMYLTQEEKDGLQSRSDDYELIKSEMSSLQEKYETVYKEYQAKLDAETLAQKEAIIASYSDSLTEEEIDSVITDINVFSVEDVDIKLAAMLGKKTKQEKSKTEEKQVFSNLETNFSNNSKWSGWLSKMQ